MAYESGSNYRTLINADMVTYPPIGGNDVSWNSYGDGRLNDAATSKIKLIPAVDWTLGDPSPSYAKWFDDFQNNLDFKSY